MCIVYHHLLTRLSPLSLFTSVPSELRRINPFQMPGSRVACEGSEQ